MSNLGEFSYECVKSSGENGTFFCRTVKKPPGNGRYTTKNECLNACHNQQHYNLSTGYKCLPDSQSGKSRCQKVAGFPGSNGIYSSEAECENNSACGALPVHTVSGWQCGFGSQPGKSKCSQVDRVPMGHSNGIYSSEAECENNSACGALPVHPSGWQCGFGSQPGKSKCSQVDRIPMGSSNGIYMSEAECENNSACGALPVGLMQEPDWAEGSVESNPLMLNTSNVGNINNSVQNYM